MDLRHSSHTLGFVDAVGGASGSGADIARFEDSSRVVITPALTVVVTHKLLSVRGLRLRPIFLQLFLISMVSAPYHIHRLAL